MLHSTNISTRVLALMNERGTRLLNANEAGSRAWGLASTDSDYDVRFIYHHPREWYLRLTPAKDTIGPLLELNGELDLAGWDLRKVLSHLVKCNPTILEWLYSPIVYHVDERFLADLRNLATNYFQPQRAVAHYLGVARGARLAGFREEDGTWNVKKFFYYLRPILAARHAAELKTMPPVAFTNLSAAIEDARISTALNRLIEEKARGREDFRATIDPALLTYTDHLRAATEAALPKLPRRQPDPEAANTFFRRTIGY